ncbi:MULTISPECIES: D-alanyl-D-alanine carboxypeptidase/D-alanyl-D-alanine-endopeptidase [unclassified Spirosoma]|uniref:D-alanyl-D-alanine carboxypeptidase/D-alanyl-D-alanine endopeptidase n=1 Tax=unclassified Spirosoma TaxID=2621999 RepID=UPI00095C8475|nr:MULTISPECIES: D-alanyl-D-alanine carboxypeptidase/D-alanyl-D-alanine-endopeptidase [unclassified Spirosoma]MBN8822573.1 D-alanyl-D-alanine carboxypeptidase/D-alanyl-D-alanine-endopeptidase [Spirosoma sp.]OJW74069.1 MAG: D-alanyl-D-alanine carboxypeptidase/D-alanyl-D-alanine-endopeptidase [Spirosoma sp. 48-14]
MRFLHRFPVQSAFVIIVCLFVGYTPSSAQTRPRQTIDSLATQKLLAQVEAFQASPTTRFGTIALSVRRVRDSEELIGYNARLSLPSASTLKLITTATALAVLGPNYTYTTTLEYDGTIKDSVLTGNLYLRGTGDPSLGSWRFPGYSDVTALVTSWSEAVKAAGIQRIEGMVVGDASLYDDITTPDTWPFGDLGNYYGASLSALNINENLYRVFFRPGKSVKAPANVLRTDPPVPYIAFRNTVSTDAANTGDQVNIYGVPFMNQQWLTGKVPLGEPGNEFSVKGALPDPAYFAAYALHNQLVQNNITVSRPPLSIGGGLPTTIPIGAKRTVINQYKSPTLPQLIQQTNFQSINLYAEALLRTTALAVNKHVRTTEESVEAITSFWKAKGVNLDGFRIRDGSGLSTVGALTADNMTGILSAMGRDKNFPQFYETIPIVGQTGTVRSLARGTAAAGNIRAKSGSIEGVRAYAGYFTAVDGEPMTFCILVNKFTPGQSRAVTNELEKIFVSLVGLKGGD